MPTSRSKPRPYHHGNLREALLLAAERLLAKRGAEALTLREVAKSAKVSHGAPYHHFKGKDALLAAVAERGFAGLTDAMLRVDAATPVERLRAIGEAYVGFARRHPARFRLMFGPLLALKREFPGLQQAAEGSFHVLLDAAQEVSPEHGLELALIGWSLSHGLSHLGIDGVFDSLPLPREATAGLETRLSTHLFRQMGLLRPPG
jgi:AcrR family transcriptional regulator